jgi:uncharacterized glyoxalase superfamily protein PhnB
LGLLELYDDALPHVYGYLLARCGDTGLAEELTAESFLAAVHAVRKPGGPDPSIPWLIGVARHKLADHWRRVEREQRGLRLLDGEPARVDDPWETVVDRIRAREAFAPSGGTMPQQTGAIRVEREPARLPTLTPYIVVSDARRAMDWYIEVFGAQRRGEVHVNPDGTIGHAEVGIGDAVLMFAEASDLWPDVPVRAPDSPATFSHSLHLEADDVDATTERARRGGASVEREPADQPYGRSSVIVNPFGHRWILLRRQPVD